MVFAFGEFDDKENINLRRPANTEMLDRPMGSSHASNQGRSNRRFHLIRREDH